MKLDLKKILAAKTLNVGKERIIFNNYRLDEIKEAITRQDIKDLFKSGAIIIKEIKGRRKNIKRKNKRGHGKIKKRVKDKKKEYVKITRKLRSYLKELKKQNKITKDKYYEIRSYVKNRKFKNKKSLKEYLQQYNQK